MFGDFVHLPLVEAGEIFRIALLLKQPIQHTAQPLSGCLRLKFNIRFKVGYQVAFLPAERVRLDRQKANALVHGHQLPHLIRGKFLRAEGEG